MLTRAVGVLLVGRATAAQLAGVGAAYLALVVAAIYVTELELRLPLVHYRTRFTQVRRAGPKGQGSVCEP